MPGIWKLQLSTSGVLLCILQVPKFQPGSLKSKGAMMQRSIVTAVNAIHYVRKKEGPTKTVSTQTSLWLWSSKLQRVVLYPGPIWWQNISPLFWKVRVLWGGEPLPLPSVLFELRTKGSPENTISRWQPRWHWEVSFFRERHLLQDILDDGRNISRSGNTTFPLQPTIMLDQDFIEMASFSIALYSCAQCL